MISRRRFLAALAASVATPVSGAEALTLPFSRSRSSLPDSSPSAWLDELDWHYRRAYSLAVRTNQRVPDLPLPRQREEPRRDPPSRRRSTARRTAASCGSASRAAASLRLRVLPLVRHAPVAALGISGAAIRRTIWP
jgi:hypothetical protein